MASIHDVARVAGVSISTVSYALSGKRSIAESTRLRITNAVEQLGYRPNAGARMLAGTRTNIFALTAPFHAETSAPAHMAFVLAVADSCTRAVQLAIEQVAGRIEPRVELVPPRYYERGSIATPAASRG
ncbi:LacI family transcriptional regulator [Cryobacterium sp. TMT1-21]|uniref:LacI family transcriptional regulator n=1 Tax=Cryobacterium shii TaxID=1259235 RepID=A0AAQ2HF47_9MICO|nr:LacI family transcriptional regulator [Cryobacterium shii]TFC84169.1 LacI family transcriptional regulator [Cryobacterium sp. TmT2-59]TFD15767.1 LacI family transcriptional regulator [Cryobacterium sp. TMT2-23]TFD17801.1 LacI family transcriptional regulator [Cryobacterium sp. TMT1-21]TFD22276.1 LacI family transcriptional regulator [Cryobacterium sp. TMT4-10]TFD44343.1 LacI family transcriptional regulator [Cryobacterium sp. TMT2-10]